MDIHDWITQIKIELDALQNLEGRGFMYRKNRLLDPPDTKYLSVKCTVEQDMSASKLNKRFPILEFLAPANPNAAALGEPAECTLDDPTTCWMLCFAGYGTLLNHGFTATAAMFDVSSIACLLHKFMDIIVIITFIGTQMLLFLLRTLDDNRDNQVVCRPLVMRIRPGDVNRQRHPTLIHQQVQFRALLAAISGILACFTPAQRCWHRLAVYRLPLPFDLAPLIVELDHLLHNPVKDAVLLPGLKALVQHAAGYAKPIPVNRFPLATRPHHIPDTVQNSPIIGWWPSPFALLGWLGQQLLDPFPQWFGYLKVIDILGFLSMMGRHGVLVVLACLATPISTSYTTFFKPKLISRIDTKLINDFTSTMNIELPDELRAFYLNCGGLRMADVHNGYFLMELTTIMDASKLELPTKVSGMYNEAVIPIGSDGGGNLFVLRVGQEKDVLFLQEVGVEDSTADIDDKNCWIVAKSFNGFLERLLLEARAFLRNDSTWKYLDEK